MQYRFLEHPRPRWDFAVICFRDYTGSQILIKAFDARPLGYKAVYGMEEFPGAPFVYEAEIHGRRIGLVTRCNWGGPQAAIVVEELAAMGVKQLVGYGAAGAIRGDLPRGTQLLVSSAPGTDGTSKIYHPTASPVRGSRTLGNQAQEAARQLGYALVEVSAATTDALYRETKEAVAAWRAVGAEVVTMEVGAFYATAKACGVRSLWLGFVSDVLGRAGWDDWHGNLREMAETTAEICLRTVGRAMR